MAITFVGAVKNGASNGNDVTTAFPAGTAVDDLIVVAYAIGDNDGVDFNMAMVNAGYTEVADLHADDTQDTDLGVFWKIITQTDLDNVTFTVDGLGGADAAVGAVAMVFRGVDTTTPMDVAPTTATGINSNRPNPPSINHNNPSGVWTVVFGAFSHTSGFISATQPTNYTEPANADQTTDDTSDITLVGAYRTNPADPEDPAIFTPSIADNVAHSWCAATLALRPAAGGGASVTPGVASLTTARFAPTVTASDHKTVTPGLATLTTARFSPSVVASDHKTVTPGTASLSLATFALTAAVSDNKLVTPGVASAALTAFSPSVGTTANVRVVPGIAALTLSAVAPSVVLNTRVVPGAASLALATFAPAVTTTAHVTVVPGTASLSLAAFAPTATGGAGLTVTPGAGSLALSALAPAVTTTAHVTVTTGVASLVLSGFAPTVTGGTGITVAPGTTTLTIATLTPSVTATAHITVSPGTATLATTSFAPTVTASNNVLITPGVASLVIMRFAPAVTVPGMGRGQKHHGGETDWTLSDIARQALVRLRAGYGWDLMASDHLPGETCTECIVRKTTH